MAEPIKVFLSYRRADTQHVAGRAGDWLGERFQIFMDIDTIPPGVDFTSYVRRAVEDCDVLLAFIGDRWLTEINAQGRRRIDEPGDWVAEEIAVALAQPDARVIPVLVENATLPAAADLPEPLRGLVNRQSLPLRHSSFSADMNRLIAGIEQVAPRTPPVPPVASPTPPAVPPPAEGWELPRTLPEPAATDDVAAAPRRRPRWLVPAAVLAGAAILGVTVALLGPFGGKPSSLGPANGTASGTFSPVSDADGLLSHIPDTFRAVCGSADPPSYAPTEGLVATVQCQGVEGRVDGSAPQYVYYFGYDSADHTAAALQNYHGSADLQQGDCSQADAEQSYERDGLSGRLRCYSTDDGYHVAAWTTDRFGLVAVSADQSMDRSQLEHWWDQAGPIS